jgi:hypothetical protein
MLAPPASCCCGAGTLSPYRFKLICDILWARKAGIDLLDAKEARLLWIITYYEVGLFM